MAPLPAESTARWKVFYTVDSHQHVQQWRTDPPPSPSAMETFLSAVWSAFTGQIFPTVVTDVQFAASGSTVFNSVAMPSFVGASFGSGTPGTFATQQFVDFIGRSSDGRRVRVSWFGNDTNDASFRFNQGENGNVDAVVALLVANSVDLATIGGLPPVWKTYADAGFNAYWQRAVRS